MIISHKYRFVFMRPHKVGGTSVHLALSFQSGEYDTVSELNNMKIGWMDEGCEDYYRHLSMRANKVKCPHDGLEQVKEKYGAYYFKRYKKISIIRNPWDAQVSAFLYLKSQNGNQEYRSIIDGDSAFCKSEFKKHILSRKKIWNIDKYCFLNGNFVLDFVLKFERLEEDYKDLCKEIGIEYIKLPRAKCMVRSNDMHYSEYYDDDDVISLVEELNRKTIDYFKYEFEDRRS